MTKLCFLAALSLCLCACDAYKILVVFPLPGRSHGILGEGFVRNLLDAGHEVTYVTPFPPKPRPGLKVVDVSENIKIMESSNVLNITQILNKDFVMDEKLLFQMMMEIANRSLNIKQFQDLMSNPNEKFDLVIPEWMFTEVYCGLAAVFDAPYIWFSSTEPHGIILQLIDDMPNPAYTPAVQSTSAPPFNFYQRVSELVLALMINFFKYVYFFGPENEIYKNAFGPILEKKGRLLPPYEELKYGASMVLGNSHVSMGQPTRLPQNFIGIGGFHIDPKIAPLPDDLQKLLDNAKHGVIYFSLGSNLKSKDLPDSIKQDLLKMFGELKQTVLWKFEEKLPNLPKNVYIIHWAPQPSILSHPNCKLFITHGGLLSTTETIYFGKPVIGIPVFADQFLNIERGRIKGFAKKVDLAYDMAKELKATIEEFLNNPKYTEKVQQLSAIFHDRPIPPGKTLVHWVEHVIKTKGAAHLRSPALHMPWYQKMYLDLLAVILLTLVIVIVALKKIFIALCSKKKIDTKKKKKN